MQDDEYAPMWQKGVYPSDELLYNATQNHELYMVIKDEICVACMIMNHEYNDEYNNVKWNVNAQKNEVTVIHALGLLPKYQKQGIAKFMVNEAIKIATENNQKAIRLDVLGTNIPAQKLYTRMGFEYRDTLKMFYEDTGWTVFVLYEYCLGVE